MTESVHQTDRCDPARAQALLTALGMAGGVVEGEALPPFFHHIYFWNAQPEGALGRDGHPKVGGLIPDTGLPRRMWAGGRLVFQSPLRAGLETEKTSTCETITRKKGRSGPLALVTLRHDYSQGGTTCVTEWQDLVYRSDPAPEAPRPVPPMALSAEDTAETVRFSTTMLFRYSALTFNGHRIHYDLDYAREVEGYEGLVVHGPLMAQLLMLKAERELGPLAGFKFRATSPVMHFETVELCRSGQQLWVRAQDGRQAMTAVTVPQSE